MSKTILELKDVTIGYDNQVIMENISFKVNQGEIWSILGQSGCGKSTLLKNIIGIYQPLSGSIEILGKDICQCGDNEKNELMKMLGITYQSGALLGSLSIGENVALPLEEHTNKSPSEIRDIVRSKLRIVGLEEYIDFMPSEISGGMKKRAGLARAFALDPEILFFDEPSAGLDPLSSAALDDIIYKLKVEHNVTIILVTHELDTIFSIVDNIVMLDKNIKRIADIGNPHNLSKNSQSQYVKDFLNRRRSITL